MRDPPGRGGGRLLARLLGSDFLVLGLALVYFLALAPFTPGLATGGNLVNVFSSMLPLLVVAVGQTFVLISGGIDLSAPSLVALTSVVGGVLMSSDTRLWGESPLAAPAAVAVAAMLACGCLLGLLNGAAVTRLGLPPFMVTLIAMMLAGGTALALTQSQRISGLPAVFLALGRGFLPALFLAGLVALLAHLVLTRTLYGRWLYAVGMNQRAALISGVPVERVLLFAYAASGASAALASVLYTARLETASPVHGEHIFLDVIGAAVLGGNSLFGGKGSVRGTVFGVLFITLIDNSLNLLSLSYSAISMVKGAVILGAAVVDSLRVRVLGETG